MTTSAPNVELCGNYDGVKQVLIPAVAVLQTEFQKTGQFVRLRIAVITKEESYSQIDAGQNKKPLPWTENRSLRQNQQDSQNDGLDKIGQACLALPPRLEVGRVFHVAKVPTVLARCDF